MEELLEEVLEEVLGRKPLFAWGEAESGSFMHASSVASILAAADELDPLRGAFASPPPTRRRAGFAVVGTSKTNSP